MNLTGARVQNRLIQIALSVAFLVLVVQVVLIAPSQIRDADQRAALLPAPAINAGSDVDQSATGMHMIETHEGGKEWELWSDRARSLKTKEMLELEVVKAIFFSDSGTTFTVTGKTGSVQVKSKDLQVDGDVLTKSSNGYVFRTQTVDYDSGSRTMRSAHPVEMTGPKDAAGLGLQLTGVGMEAKLDQNTMEILSDVRSTRNLDKGRKAHIRSRRARFSAADRTAKFFGDVVLDMDSMRITGPEATFEYDSGSDVLKSVVFSGGARVSDMDKWATAQNVRVDFEKDQFVFKGSPRVVQNNDELRGEEIIFLDGGKRVQVKSARAKVDEKRLEKQN
jgi:LPS export ABC transporter protein LptC/lipopolysaccharide transport protein LptA